MTFFLLFEEVCLINLYLLLLLLIEFPNQRRIEEKLIPYFDHWFIRNISTRINTGTLRHSLKLQVFLHYFHPSSSASQIISRYFNLFLYKYFSKSM